MPSYVKPERISLAAHPAFNEKWVQQLIADDPSILGLGELILKDQERIQPKAGRLDLLLQDAETKRRYEVELQLGSTDEAHIIRSIEYWDIERKRYPQYDHCAILIAEDITSRFLNVISLFNGTIPFIAIQMQCIRIGDAVTLVFTTVVNELQRGLVDSDEDEEAAPADRVYWENRAPKSIVALADNVINLVKDKDSSLSLKYNRNYIGVSKDGRVFNFVTFRPKRSFIKTEISLPRTTEWDQKIDQNDFDMLEYARWGAYRFRLTREDVETKSALLSEMLGAAYDLRVA